MCTDIDPPRNPSPGDGAGEPSDDVTPHSNQHIAPADRPASTTPDSQHSRRIWSSPNARQTASKPSIEPPPTYTMSCPSNVSRSGIGREPRRNSEMCIGSQAREPNVAWNWRIWASPSPEAVGSRQIFGIETPGSDSTKSSRAGLCGSMLKPPPPIARIVGRRSGGGEFELRALAEIGGLQRELHDVLFPGLDAVGPRLGSGEHHAMQVLADEVQGGPIGGRVSAGQRSILQRGVVRRAPVGLLLVVHGVGVGQESEPRVWPRVVVVGRQA